MRISGVRFATIVGVGMVFGLIHSILPYVLPGSVFYAEQTIWQIASITVILALLGLSFAT